MKTQCKSEGSMQGIIRQVFAFILLSNSPLWKWTKGEAGQKLPFGDVDGGNVELECVKSHRRRAKSVVQVCFSTVAGI